jgi:hypothetical protein
MTTIQPRRKPNPKAPLVRPRQVAPAKTAASSAKAMPRDSFGWCVNVGPPADMAEAKADLKRIQGLGARMVRIDIGWDEIEPQRGRYDAKRLAFFKDYIAEAKRLGIEVTPVLSHPPAWAMALYNGGDKKAFFKAYEGYTRQVATSFGDDITYYQYWNEANAAIDKISRDDDWQLFLAGDRGVREGDRNGSVGAINFITDVWDRNFWLNELEHTVGKMNAADPNHRVRLIGLDEYPGTWSPGGAGTWKALDQLMAKLDDPKSAIHGFDATVMETGYSSFVPKIPFLYRMAAAFLQVLGLDRFMPRLGDPVKSQARQEQKQADWYRQALPTLRQKLNAFNQAHPEHGFKFMNLYTLFDGEAGKPYDPEANFGLMRRDRSEKPAAEVVRKALK